MNGVSWSEGSSSSSSKLNYYHYRHWFFYIPLCAPHSLWAVWRWTRKEVYEIHRSLRHRHRHSLWVPATVPLSFPSSLFGQTRSQQPTARESEPLAINFNLICVDDNIVRTRCNSEWQELVKRTHCEDTIWRRSRGDARTIRITVLLSCVSVSLWKNREKWRTIWSAFINDALCSAV